MDEGSWPADDDTDRVVPRASSVNYVADTMYACLAWFVSYKVSYTAADLLAMTRMVLDRDHEARGVMAADPAT
jgi:hypothetical protein